MSEAAPEGGRPRGGGQGQGRGLSKKVGPLPMYGWVVIIGAGAGALLWIKLRGGSASSGTSGTSTSSPVDTTGAVPDDTTQLSEYEQVSSQLTGIEGTQEALLAAVKDLQGNGTSGGGGTQVKVPDIVGMRGSAARAKIAAAGLNYKQSPETTPRGAETEVTSQSPDAGTEVGQGSDVTAQVRIRSGGGSGTGGGDNDSSGGSSGGGGDGGGQTIGNNGAPVGHGGTVGSGSPPKRGGSTRGTRTSPPASSPSRPPASSPTRRTTARPKAPARRITPRRVR